MRRIPAVLATATTTLGLVLATSIPAHAATRATFPEQRGDVQSNDGTALTRAEKKIDTLGKLAFKTAKDGRRDVLVMRARAKDFRGSGNHWMYVFIQQPDGPRTFVMANLGGSRAHVFPNEGATHERCRGGGVKANLQRDIATLRMPSRCLNSGARSVTLSDAGTVFANRASLSTVDAYDPKSGGSTKLNYR